MMFINKTSYDTIWQANHYAACVYRRKSQKYERSADRQSAEITAYPTFIMLSAMNSSLCIIPVMCCRNAIHCLQQYFSIYP